MPWTTIFNANIVGTFQDVSNEWPLTLFPELILCKGRGLAIMFEDNHLVIFDWAKRGHMKCWNKIFNPKNLNIWIWDSETVPACVLSVCDMEMKYCYSVLFQYVDKRLEKVGLHTNLHTRWGTERSIGQTNKKRNRLNVVDWINASQNISTSLSLEIMKAISYGEKKRGGNLWQVWLLNL